MFSSNPVASRHSSSESCCPVQCRRRLYFAGQLKQISGCTVVGSGSVVVSSWLLAFLSRGGQVVGKGEAATIRVLAEAVAGEEEGRKKEETALKCAGRLGEV